MIPLAIPSLEGNEAKYLMECVETNFVSSVGPFVERFSTEVANESGAKYGVPTSSGTSAIHLALTTLGVKHNDLVILPTFTFIASANAISHTGASPWLFDIDSNDWSLNLEQLEETLSRETENANDYLVHKKTGRKVSAIMTVYPLGIPTNMTPLRALAKKYNLPLIADAAAALGAKYKGEKIGDLADITTFSFNGNKIITSGGGGMLVGNNKKVMMNAKHICTTARVGRNYDHDQIGFNYRMTNIQAAVGCAQLELLHHFLSRKEKIDSQYRHALKNHKSITFFPIPEWAKPTFWLSGIVLKKAEQARRIIDHLNNNKIDARPFWKPIHLQEPYKNAPIETTKNADELWNRIVTLPSSVTLTEEEQKLVIEKTLEAIS